MLDDMNIKLDKLTVYCDNTSAIKISKNPVQHSKTKHIKIRYHYVRELVEQELVELVYVPTEGQLADIFTKVLDSTRFEKLRVQIGVCRV